MEGFIELMRTGCHLDSGGERRCFSEGDLQISAQAYHPEFRLAPLVLGHPSDDRPRFGWVKRLYFGGGSLWGEPMRVSPHLPRWLNEGRYKKVSAAFFPPDHPRNPRPGTFYLKHVGFFGAHPTSVKGLRVAFFGEWSVPYVDDREIESVAFSSSAEFAVHEGVVRALRAAAF